MKTELLKNEDDIFFMLKRTLKPLHYINTSSMFLFFSGTRCLTEIVSSRSDTYSSQSLSDDRRLFAALYNGHVVLIVNYIAIITQVSVSCTFESTWIPTTAHLETSGQTVNHPHYFWENLWSNIYVKNCRTATCVRKESTPNDVDFCCFHIFYLLFSLYQCQKLLSGLFCGFFQWCLVRFCIHIYF